jgi:hypothetical protein
MKKFIVLLCVFCLFPIVGSAQSPLADAARRERARQKAVHSSVTFTGAATTTAVTTSPEVSSVPAPVVKPFVMTDNNGHDEKYWRERFDKARADLKSAEDPVRLLDNNVKGLNTAFLTRSDIYNKENALGQEISDDQKELEDARNQVEQARQKISDLEDELHRTGGPAGWAR